MAPSGLGRYIVTSPATSRDTLVLLRDAEDDGTSTVLLSLMDIDTHEPLDISLKVLRSRSRDMSVEYIGKLADESIATITVMTHPDLSDNAARLTLVR